MGGGPDHRGRALLAALALSEEERERRLTRAADPAYWLALNPDLTIAGSRSPSVTEAAPWSPHTLDEIVTHLRTDGYLEATPFIDPRTILALRGAVDRIRAEGWPPVFVFVYDQVWDLARTPSVQALLRAVLGPGYREDTLVWCFHVAPTPGASGWAPHFDGPEVSNRLTLWFPLTDATLRNGCMYIVPDGALPESITNTQDVTTVGWPDLSATLKAVRALPCNAGGLLGWRFHVLHWGSQARHAEHPRISVAMEFLAADITPEAVEAPLIDGAGRPDDLHLRLYAIGKSLHTYMQFEPRCVPFRELAQALEQRYRPAGAGTI